MVYLSILKEKKAEHKKNAKINNNHGNMAEFDAKKLASLLFYVIFVCIVISTSDREYFFFAFTIFGGIKTSTVKKIRIFRTEYINCAVDSIPKTVLHKLFSHIDIMLTSTE